jgi:alpha-L-fucosidase
MPCKQLSQLRHFFFISACVLFYSFSTYAQDNNSISFDRDYYEDLYPGIKERIDEWQDLKFGLLMHWGAYSQWGIDASWSICPEDVPWAAGGRKDSHGGTYVDYVKNYEQLQKTFNPINFNPDTWARLAKDAGMKYVIFTTKHHDGFCMFDAHETNYKVTDSSCAFSANPKSNIAKEVFNAFRKENFWVGAYFSKPDWHSDYYWWRRFPPVDRNPSYSIEKYPERWKKFMQYTYNQIDDLTSNYGKLDILWLDGGWVRIKSQNEISNELKDVYEKNRPIKNAQSQDLKMFELASLVRANQPKILIVDRDVKGYQQNYLTPEQTIFDKVINTPWETCMTMADSWGWVPGEKYKSADELIHKLVDIVSKGGNFLLNIGPNALGEFDTAACNRLKEIGNWMKINGESIYSSRPFRYCSDGDQIRYTKSKDGLTIYVFVMNYPNQTIHLKNIWERGFIEDIRMLGCNAKVHYSISKETTDINLPSNLKSASNYVWVLKIKLKKKALQH